MPISDDEIVNRSLACRPFAGTLRVITYDTGQSTRSTATSLSVDKLSHDLGPRARRLTRSRSGPPRTPHKRRLMA